MADFLTVRILGDRTVLRNLDQMPDTVRAILVEKTRGLTNLVAERARQNIDARLSKTGKSKQYSGSPTKLRDAVEVEVTDEGLRVEGQVYISGIPYARAQEEGAIIPPHIIRPRNAKVLAFMASTGDKVFATRVFHPGGQIPAAHYLKDAYRETSPQISRDIKSSIVKGIREKMRSGR